MWMWIVHVRLVVGAAAASGGNAAPQRPSQHDAPLPPPAPQVPITVVVGPPLLVTQYTGPTSDPAFAAAVAQLHASYLHALQRLYDANKDKYALGRVRDLRLVA